MHFYSRVYPALPGTLNPPDATVADYRRVRAWLGLERAIRAAARMAMTTARCPAWRRSGQRPAASWW
jgi:hypothetical protein